MFVQLKKFDLATSAMRTLCHVDMLPGNLYLFTIHLSFTDLLKFQGFALFSNIGPPLYPKSVALRISHNQRAVNLS